MKYTYKKMAGGGSVKSEKGYTAKDRKAIRSLIEELADPHSVDVTGGSSVTVVKEPKKRMAAGGSVGPGGGMMGGSGSGGSARTAPSSGGRTTSSRAVGGRGPASPSRGGGGGADAGRGGGDRSISVSPSPRERSTPQSATGKSVGYGGRKPGPEGASRPGSTGVGGRPPQAKPNLPAAFGGPSRTNNSIAAGIARAGRSLGNAVGSAQRGPSGMATGGIVGRPARSYHDMKAGAGSGVGRIQKTKIARGR